MIAHSMGQATKSTYSFSLDFIQRPIDRSGIQENIPVNFDQFGALTRKLKIKHVPAKVVQEGQRLKVEEIPLGDL